MSSAKSKRAGEHGEYVGPELWAKGSKYSAIVKANNGKLYLVPHNAYRVISFNPRTNEGQEIGEDFTRFFKYKWNGGILAENGKIYCAPGSVNDILVIDPETETTELIPVPAELKANNDQYGTVSTDTNGNVYFFPTDSTAILKMDINTKTFTTIPSEGGWEKAILASTGHTYAMPAQDITSLVNENSFVKIFDPVDGSTKKIELPRIFRGYNYSALAEHRDGHLYSFSEGYVVKINMKTFEHEIINIYLGYGEWKTWTGAAAGYDGCIYGVSQTKPHLVRFDPIKETVTFGLVSSGSHWENWDALCQADDGNIYCCPGSADQIVKIRLPRGHWFYLKHRLLNSSNRATVDNLAQTAEDEEDNKNLGIILKFITATNDDEFRCVLNFI